MEFCLLDQLWRSTKLTISVLFASILHSFILWWKLSEFKICIAWSSHIFLFNLWVSQKSFQTRKFTKSRLFYKTRLFNLSLQTMMQIVTFPVDEWNRLRWKMSSCSNERDHFTLFYSNFNSCPSFYTCTLQGAKQLRNFQLIPTHDSRDLESWVVIICTT